MYIESRQKPDISRSPEGVICFRFPEAALITLDRVEECIAGHKRLAPNMKSPVMFSGNHGNPMDREIVERVTRQDVLDITTAVALVTDTAVGRMLGNIFLRFISTPLPTRLFATEEDAIAWLTEQ